MSKTLLIIDGSREYREFLVDFFSKRDIEVESCATYKEAQRLLTEVDFKAVIVDYSISGTGEDDLVSTIAMCREKILPVIIMNEKQTPAIERRIRSLGPAFYFVKSAILDDLYSIVLRIVDFSDKKYLQNKMRRVKV